ncbi:MAG: type II toxin-antitoxin system VapC family toxin [Clostridiales bacterium]|jgi:PIN domain nuclease of toxin-antitoxin system|nr:type II toxin-antitoxin system VapC family toxin [Clostridiales bacterium]
MRYLLDTHVILWVAEKSPLIPGDIYRILRDDESPKFVSIASAWEIAIKLRKGSLKLDGGINAFFEIIDYNGFFELPIRRDYLSKVTNLPLHHKDPFDRILIATALAENLTFITIDEDIRKYNIPNIW